MTIYARMETALDGQTAIAWAAGLFEGEGCIRCSTTTRVSVRLQLGMTDFDVVERFAAVVGCGRMRLVQHRGNWKPMKYWSTSKGVDLVAILEAFMPWFGERRRAKASEALEVARSIRPHPASRTHCAHGHPYSDENTYVSTDRHGRKSRHCKTCQLAWQRAEYHEGAGRERAKSYRAAHLEAIKAKDRARAAAHYRRRRDQKDAA